MRAAEFQRNEPLIRHHGAMLRMAVETLLADIGQQFLDQHHASSQMVLDALAPDHLAPTRRAA